MIECIIEYWVEALDGTIDTTVPFLAQSKDHADAWIAQPFAQGRYHVVTRISSLRILGAVAGQERGGHLRILHVSPDAVRVDIMDVAHQTPLASLTLTASRAKEVSAMLATAFSKRWQPQDIAPHVFEIEEEVF